MSKPPDSSATAAGRTERYDCCATVSRHAVCQGAGAVYLLRLEGSLLARLYFHSSAMNAAKSTTLLQADFTAKPGLR
jgi:hypothetical protein